MQIRPTRRSMSRHIRHRMPRRTCGSAATPVRTTLRLLMAIALVTMLALAGCAGRTAVGDAPDADDRRDDRLMDEPVCRVIEGDPSLLPEAVDSAWWQDGGNMRCVVVDDSLSPSRDDAVGLAAERLLPGAFEMLQRRGVMLTESRRDDVAEAFSHAVVRGENAGFPRISIRESVVERCETPDGVEHWRARLLAEYPIGVLRGDVTHAQWEGRRTLREMDMRVESAGQLLADGRWSEALHELVRAGELERRVDPSAVLRTSSTAFRELLASALGVRIVRVDGSGPIGIRVGSRERVRYRVEYPLGDEWVHAAGVPVSIEGGDSVLPVMSALQTDASGEVTLEFAAGEESTDDAVLLRVKYSVPKGDVLPGRSAVPSPVVIAQVRQELLVLSSREATVCVEISAGRAGGAASDSAADRVREALSNSLDALGASLVDCGPDASLVVTADVSLSTQETHGTWLAHIECSVRAFDQRLAEDVGRVSFEVKESLESSARDAEMLALREVGRLVAVYLEPRLAER